MLFHMFKFGFITHRNMSQLKPFEQLPHIELVNGVLDENVGKVHMPVIGLGCWSGTTPETQAAAKEWIVTALKAGYKHLDTAHGYGTEGSVGKAIREYAASIGSDPVTERRKLFITTKLPPQHGRTVEDSINESLARAEIDYYDLYLVHWPQSENASGGLDEAWDFTRTWEGMQKVLEKKLVRAIGVSNFSIKNLKKLLEAPTTTVWPAVNQVELHPLLAQPGLLEYCKTLTRNGKPAPIFLTAYTPTGYDTVRSNPKIVELAKRYNTSPAQIVLSWHVARGGIAVPKSTDVQRQKDNLNLYRLPQEAVTEVTALDKEQRLCNKPDADGKVWGWTMEQMGW